MNPMVLYIEGYDEEKGYIESCRTVGALNTGNLIYRLHYLKSMIILQPNQINLLRFSCGNYHGYRNSMVEYPRYLR